MYERRKKVSSAFLSGKVSEFCPFWTHGPPASLKAQQFAPAFTASQSRMPRLVITMSTRDRHSGRSRTGRPPERSQRSATSGWRVFAAVILLLSLVLPITLAQPSPSAPGPIQNLSIAAIPALINLTPLNSTRPTIQLSLPPTPDLFLTFNLCSLTSNSSLLPTVLISTAADPAWSLGARSTADSGSGGTREGGHNRRSRQGAVWSLVWDKGFGNWTMSGMGQGEQVKMLLSLDVDVNGAFRSGVGAGNMVIQLGVSSMSERTYNPLSMTETDDQTLCMELRPILHSSETRALLRCSYSLTFCQAFLRPSPPIQTTPFRLRNSLYSPLAPDRPPRP